MASMSYGLSPHRTKHARTCDRCRDKARYNYRPQEGPVQYFCEKHAPKEDA